ncbi:hypothetical protein FisN_1Lh056 [Fistulifera solaris]|uniref:Uncharacterized protein n=1 Tax=Fistulifera solaris TaxID=1519565 RepID=A0A1Z5JCG2_FISSO|nr:hypothetical protein FisN_1Lh056 [Fistulifera solaris]|eukprot:GAX11582.1 hypothetical protein FisN_1Lh056 [Fistulifera solaris]
MTTQEHQLAMAKACVSGDLDAVNDLLKNGYDFRIPITWNDKDGKECKNAPIFIAVDFGYSDMVRTFIDHGWGMNEQDDSEYTALDWAGWTGQLDLVKSLVELGASPGQDGLDLAREGGHKDVVEFLMQNMDLYKHLEGDEDEIMMKATREGDLDKVKELLEKGYDLDKWKDESGNYQAYSPISVAYRTGNMKIMQVFMENGMEVEYNFRDNEQVENETS